MLPTWPLIISPVHKPFMSPSGTVTQNLQSPTCPFHVFTEFWFVSEDTSFSMLAIFSPAHELHVQEEKLAFLLLPVELPSGYLSF